MSDTTGWGLSEADLESDPMAQFSSWFEEAKAVVRMPEAIALATADRAGRPSVRMVLLKGWDERGFVFYTDGTSRKGAELAANPHAALVAYWDPLGRQVRVEGAVEAVATEESDRYWATRPRGSQLAARASHQSRELADRVELEAAVAAEEAGHAGGEVPRPPAWGGYRVVPHVVEFWQHRENRLHDRLCYRRRGTGWGVLRLSP
jgi:pyridoxamine 5'-phosphate oxidase